MDEPGDNELLLSSCLAILHMVKRKFLYYFRTALRSVNFQLFVSVTVRVTAPLVLPYFS